MIEGIPVLKVNSAAHPQNVVHIVHGGEVGKSSSVLSKVLSKPEVSGAHGSKGD